MTPHFMLALRDLRGPVWVSENLRCRQSQTGILGEWHRWASQGRPVVKVLTLSQISSSRAGY